MKGHLVATVVWLALIGGGYLAFTRYLAPAPVSGCEDSGSAAITLSAAPDGHFYVEGAINGTKVPFLVDTGASYVTVGGADAGRIGLPEGAPATFGTAAGTVTGAMVRGQHVQAGCFEVPDLAVAVSPAMHGPALLGQNFLRRFELTIRDRTLVLRRREAP